MSVGIVLLLVILAAPTIAWAIHNRHRTEQSPNKNKTGTAGPKHRWWQP